MTSFFVPVIKLYMLLKSQWVNPTDFLVLLFNRS